MGDIAITHMLYLGIKVNEVSYLDLILIMFSDQKILESMQREEAKLKSK